MREGNKHVSSVSVWDSRFKYLEVRKCVDMAVYTTIK